MNATAVPELWQLSDRELATELAARHRATSQAYARELAALAEAERRGLATSLGKRDLVTWLMDDLRLSRHDARTRLAEAVATQDTGAPLAAVGAALRAGAISREHARIVCDLFARCPSWVTPEQRAASEADLVDLALQATPEALRKAAHRVAGYWDQDGKPPAEEQRELAEPHREFRYQRTRGGGMRFVGQFDPETATTLEGLFGPLAKPRPADEEGVRDRRTAAQRHGDALAEIIDTAARADDLTVQGGERAVMIVTVTLAELEERARDAMLTVPAGTDVEKLRRWACEARAVPAIFGNRGEVLYLGRSSRHATAALRRALALRDGGCARPGCTRPPKWCQPHHAPPWGQHGTSDLDTMVLLCDHHHREIHHTAWEVRIVGGVPEFIPPAWVDPNRRPRRNRAHHHPSRRAA